MIDNVYTNAFTEIYYILQNTEEQLLNKIPNKFMQFIQNNMNKSYNFKIQKDIPIDEQSLLKETEAILSLIYRSYWATNEEKIAIINNDKQEFLEGNENQKFKDIYEVFEHRKNINTVTIDNNLMIIPKENFIKKLLNKIKSVFKLL